MIAGVTPYSEYKESGQGWLGKVPRHWEVRPAFGAFVPNHERNRGMIEKTVLSLSYGRIVIKPLEKLHGLVPESFETYQVVNPGYIVLRTTDLQNDHTSLRVGMVKNRGIITSAYLALRVMDGVIPEFGYQFLNVWDMSKAIYGYGSGLRQNLDFSHFKRMLVAIPSIEEQTAIVKFLGSVNGRLERTIRAKRKAILLLKEQKQAVIHHAVTRGLNPKAPMKPTGVPWLDEVPQHWNICKARQIGQFHKGLGGSKEDNVALGVPCIRYGELYTTFNNVIRKAKSFISQERADSYTPIRYGDVLFAASGEKVNEIGKSAVNLMTESVVCGGDVIILRLTKPAHVPFLGYAFDTYHTSYQKATMCRGTTIKHIYPDELKSLWIPLPPVPEQERITAFLDGELKRFDIALERTQREIELIRELRTRLTADVVTGKFDVRKAASQLPKDVIAKEALAADDTIEEPEPEESAL